MELKEVEGNFAYPLNATKIAPRLPQNPLASFSCLGRPFSDHHSQESWNHTRAIWSRRPSRLILQPRTPWFTPPTPTHLPRVRPPSGHTCTWQGHCQPRNPRVLVGPSSGHDSASVGSAWRSVAPVCGPGVLEPLASRCIHHQHGTLHPHIP